MSEKVSKALAYLYPAGGWEVDGERIVKLPAGAKAPNAAEIEYAASMWEQSARKERIQEEAFRRIVNLVGHERNWVFKQLQMHQRFMELLLREELKTITGVERLERNALLEKFQKIQAIREFSNALEGNPEADLAAGWPE